MAPNDLKGRFGQLVRAWPEPLIILGSDLTIQMWNDAAVAMFGWAAEEMVGGGAERLPSPGEGSAALAEAEDRLSRVMQGLQTLSFEGRYARRDGGEIEVLVTLAPLVDSHGQAVGCFYLAHDMTERNEALRAHEARARELEARTVDLEVRTRELEQSNHALERFAFATSHDLQEPLRMVASITQLLARRIEPHLDDESRGMIDLVVGSAKRMQDLVNDLLSFSRLHLAPATSSRTDPMEVLDRELEHLADQLDREGGRIVIDTPLPALRSDPAELGQLWRNLLANALRYRSADPPEIHTGCSGISDGMAALYVRDNGIGIDEADHQRIFEPFTRIATSSSRGSGLGLAICRAIALRYGGDIRVESTPGAGSTFTWTVPVVDEGA